MSSPSPFHFFGIRHHGPGCARSLVAALDALQPDCLLVEGPPEGEALLPLLQEPDLRPPVALLVYPLDTPEQAAFYPFAEFSPEWQALQWGQRAGIPIQFFDLPQAHTLALKAAASMVDATDQDSGDEATCLPQPEAESNIPPDPLDWLAQAAGESDGERWWSRLVEERAGDDASVFTAIAEAMTAVRSTLDAEAPHWRGAAYAQRQALREAWMRQRMRQAAKDGHQRIAVICGAWHVPALQATVTAKADTALLKTLPKARLPKLQATWTPWTYRHLTQASGYGAGIDSPGWYEHVWQQSPAHPQPQPLPLPAGQQAQQRSIAWLAKVAQLLRTQGLDCSSAQLIDATRLADSLAALRGYAQPGLQELHEAVRSVICMGAAQPLQWIDEALTIGQRLGSVPAAAPQVPLQRDIEQQQKTLRLKPQAEQQLLHLDLRKDLDRSRSHFLHRLRLLGIDWGQPSTQGPRNKGTFRESWQLQWQPEMSVDIVQASLHGHTVAQACTAKLHALLGPQTPLRALADAIHQALLADLADLAHTLIATLAANATQQHDVSELLHVIPPLAQLYRYGSVRQTDSQLLTDMLDDLLLRAAIGLPLASSQIDHDAAQALHTRILACHEALHLRYSAEEAALPAAAYAAWYSALQKMLDSPLTAALVRGAACRLLLDGGQLDSQSVARHFNHSLSSGVEPLDMAAWLDGFLNQQALVLLHDDVIWGAVDQWLTALSEEQFRHVLPLVRRSFAAFTASERHSLGHKALHSSPGTAARPTPLASAADAPWDEARATLALPALQTLMGLAAPVEPTA